MGVGGVRERGTEKRDRQTEIETEREVDGVSYS